MENKMKKINLALSSPEIVLCDPMTNAEILSAEAHKAATQGAEVIAFPELAITGATLGDLFGQEPLLFAAERALEKYVEMTADISLISFIGLPLLVKGKIYNTVAAVSEGRVLGITASRDTRLSRYFTTLSGEQVATFVGGRDVIVSDILTYISEKDGARIIVEIGECDYGRTASLVEADLVINPTAVPEYVGLAEARRYRAECRSVDGTVYATVGAGVGESGTDGVYAGVRLITKGGRAIMESAPFDSAPLIRNITLGAPTRVRKPREKTPGIEKFPFIPKDEGDLALAVKIQSVALAKRLVRSYSRKAVIGVSGGLDSTLAVLVAAYAMDEAGLPRENVVAITMPCFGTTSRTKSNALALATALGCTVREIDIKRAVSLHFEDIGHEEGNYNVVYENAQARERTQILMDIANAEGGLVVGTGDLSELALGFATYGGDHLSMYGVNASIPKTLMRAILRYEAGRYAERGEEIVARTIIDVVDTPVSPELLPVGEESENKQYTERIVGPYELHDFFLYYLIGERMAPDKVLRIGARTFTDYTKDEISGYLEIFVRRFFSQQFKRSCMPDGPRVTEISLSPRSAWQMPSDVSAVVWKEYFTK